MEQTWWIHISEAVRVYNRTRQTFYNRINKWYIETKKIHNKVYLLIEDIEKVISDYIEANPSSYVPIEQDTKEAKKTNNPNSSPEASSLPINFEEDQSLYISEIFFQELHQNKQEIYHSLQDMKQELRSDIQRASTWVQQQVDTVTYNLEQKLSDTKETEIVLGKKVKLLHKKLSFWIGYICFVLINLLIIGYLIS